MQLQRTQFAMDAIRAHLEAHGRDALIESFFVQYLLICLYSEMEDGLAKVISNRLAEIDDPKVSNFIRITNDAMIRRTKKADINDILKKFGCEENHLIENEIEGKSMQPYFDAISNRHLVSHAAGCNMTIDDFEKSVECAEMLFDLVKKAISK
ncbi:hypothetical protein ACWKWJ_12370 [Sphingopyxis terrae subsp. ummariensis]